MKWALSLTMESSLAGVRKLAAIVGAALAEEASPRVRSEVELALVEACTNAVKHRSPGSSSATFHVEVELGAEGLRLVVENQGKPFDFTGAKRPQFDPQKLETLPARGMGLGLIRDIMEDVQYEACQGLNRLVMVKRLDGTGGDGARAEVRS